MMLLRLAWRNIWRNRRRSLIILASIVFGVTAMNFFDGIARGFMMQIFTNQLGAHTAHMQIHARGFNDNKVVQNFMPDPDSVEALLRSRPEIKNFSRRVITFGLLSSASSSAGVLIVGTEPQREAEMTTIKSNIIAGTYLGNEGSGIVLSKRLAQTLDVGLGDRVVTMASSLDGTIGSELFRVVGLYQSPSIAFDKMYIYVPLATLQRTLRVGQRVAEFAVLAKNVDSVEALKRELSPRLGSSYEVLTYNDLLPSLVSQINLMGSVMTVFYFLIGAAMIFGIVNTLLMSVFERIHEFGVLKSIGMKNHLVFSLITIEAFLLGIVGTVFGTFIGIGLNMYLAYAGLNLAVFSEGLAAFGTGAILYPILNWDAVVIEIIVVLCICVVAAMYPAVRAVRLEPVRAIYFE